MDDRRPLRVGVVGPGWIWQREHLLGYLKTTRGAVVGFHAPDETARVARDAYLAANEKRLRRARDPLERSVREEALRARVFDDLDVMLREVDCVDVATPPAFHVPVARAALRAGKPVLCEKPLARSFVDVGDLREVHAVAERESGRPLPFCLFTQFVTNPAFQAGRRLVESGDLGEVARVRALVATGDLSHTTSKAFFWTPELSGGGALADMGPHAFSVAWYWLRGAGDFRPVAVRSVRMATRVPVRSVAGRPPAPVVVEDDAVVEVEWRDHGGAGDRVAYSTLEASWGPLSEVSPKEGKHHMFFEVEGDRGTAHFPNGTLGIIAKPKFHAGVVLYFKVTRPGPGGRVEKVKLPMPRRHVESEVMVDQFLAAVAGDGDPVNDLRFAVDSTRVVGAAYLSERRDRQWVRLAQFDEHAAERFRHHARAGATDPGALVVRELLGLDEPSGANDF